MEAVGVGGALMGVVLVPGLLAAGIGSLIYVGLDDWTGLRDVLARGARTFRRSGAPPAPSSSGRSRSASWPRSLGTCIRRLALALQPIVERAQADPDSARRRRRSACSSSIFVEATDRSSAYVLFSGQDQLAPLIDGAAGWTVGALLLLVLCKGLAYAIALSGFRGGPVFPGMFIGAVGGIALSHLPGLPMIAGAAMGIGAMTVAMLGLPLVSVLLVAAVPAGGRAGADAARDRRRRRVSYVVSARLPAPSPARRRPPHDQGRLRGRPRACKNTAR